MIFGAPDQTQCSEVLHSLVLYIDHEILDQNEIQKIEIHFQQCPPCQQELTHEQIVLGRLKELIGDACNETAPDTLHEKILTQTDMLAQQMQAQFFGMNSSLSTHVVTQFSRTEFTSDGIETRIEIETTEITHHFEVEE
jgi:mycothiol system anti-sigma-R factor